MSGFRTTRRERRDLDDRSPCVFAPPRFHPHLGTTLWIVARKAVDRLPSTGGQPRGQPGMKRGQKPSRRSCSTAPANHPPTAPRDCPHPAAPRDLGRGGESTPPTGPMSTAVVLFFLEHNKNNGVDGSSSGRSGSPRTGLRADVTPGPRRLYGEPADLVSAGGRSMQRAPLPVGIVHVSGCPAIRSQVVTAGE